jgi:hypothetical protein
MAAEVPPVSAALEEDRALPSQLRQGQSLQGWVTGLLNPGAATPDPGGL